MAVYNLWQSTIFGNLNQKDLLNHLATWIKEKVVCMSNVTVNARFIGFNASIPI